MQCHTKHFVFKSITLSHTTNDGRSVGRWMAGTKPSDDKSLLLKFIISVPNTHSSLCCCS